MADTIGDLCRLSDVPTATIDAALAHLTAGTAYERFEIPKLGPRAPRVISAPVPALKQVQRGLIRVLEPLSLSSAVHGFRRGRSIVTGAKAHVASRALINIDLADFFHSVDRPRVVRTLRRSLIRRVTEETEELTPAEGEALVQLIATLATWPVDRRPQPVLPQGAPSSPFLANLAARPLDSEVLALLRSLPGEYVYTRYADDLSISSPHELHRSLLGAVLERIHREGFTVNAQKVRIASTIKGSPHYTQKLEVTGLIIDHVERRVRIPRSKMQSYRVKLHQAALAPKIEPEELREIEGIISFVHMVYGELPPSLAAPYRKFAEVHRQPVLRPGKSRRRARKSAVNEMLYR